MGTERLKPGTICETNGLPAFDNFPGAAPPLKGYAKTISEATGYTNPKHLAEIEDCMRQDIFHSTLDWQTRKQLMDGARLAVEVLIQLGILPALNLTANKRRTIAKQEE